MRGWFSNRYHCQDYQLHLASVYLPTILKFLLVLRITHDDTDNSWKLKYLVHYRGMLSLRVCCCLPREILAYQGVFLGLGLALGELLLRFPTGCNFSSLQLLKQKVCIYVSFACSRCVVHPVRCEDLPYRLRLFFFQNFW